MRCRRTVGVLVLLTCLAAPTSTAVAGTATRPPADPAGTASPLPADLSTYLAADRTDTEWSLAATHASAAWTVSTGSGVVVAVIDTGVDDSNPDLSGQVVAPAHLDPVTGRIIPGARPDLVGHGTHVAGIIAAKADGHGITGVAPGSTVLPIDVATTPELTGVQVAAAIRYAIAHTARVINLSLGEPNIEITAADVGPVCAAIGDATAAGVVVVAAAGNDGDGMNLPEAPAGCAGAVSVAAIGSTLQPTAWSSFDGTVSVAAPGDDIYSTVPSFVSRLRYATMSGTSMASPFVAGVAALLVSEHPDWTPEQVKSRLEDTATDVGPAGVDPRTGHGVVDPAAAVGAVAPAVTPVAHLAVGAQPYPRPTPDGGVSYDATYVNWVPDPSTAVTGYTVTRYGAEGTSTVDLGPLEVRYVYPYTSGGYTVTAHTASGDIVSAPVWYDAEDTGNPPAFQISAPTRLRAAWTRSGAVRVSWSNPARNAQHADRWMVMVNDELVAGNERPGRVPRSVLIPARDVPSGDLRVTVYLASTADSTDAQAALTLGARVPFTARAVPAGPGRYRLYLTLAGSWARRACPGSRTCSGAGLLVTVGGHRWFTRIDSGRRAVVCVTARSGAHRLATGIRATSRRTRLLTVSRLVVVVR